MEENIKQVTALFKALSNENRLLIFCALLERPMTVSEIAQCVPGFSKSALSQHLTMLKSQGLLESSKSGQRVTYALIDQRVTEIIKTLKKFYAGESDAHEGAADHFADRHSHGERVYWHYRFVKQQ